MSDVIKLNLKSQKINVSLRNQFAVGQIKQESSEDLLQLQFAQQYQRGYDAGRKSTLEQYEEDYNEKLNKKYSELDHIIETLNNQVNEYSIAFEKLTIKMSLLISEKIVKHEILLNPIIEEVINDALKRVIGANKIMVKLNPGDLKELNALGKNFLSGDSLSKINFETDERIDPGGCLVESEIGNVDSRISTQINELKKLFEANYNLDKT